MPAPTVKSAQLDTARGRLARAVELGDWKAAAREAERLATLETTELRKLRDQLTGVVKALDRELASRRS